MNAKDRAMDLLRRKVFARLLPPDDWPSPVCDTVVRSVTYPAKDIAKAGAESFRRQGWYVSHAFPLKFRSRWIVLAIKPAKKPRPGSKLPTSYAVAKR